MTDPSISRLAAVTLLALLTGSACKQHPREAPPLKTLAPSPLGTLAPLADADGGTLKSEDREAAYRVVPAPVYGTPLPADAQRISVSDGHVWLGTADWNPGEPGANEQLAQYLNGHPALVTTDGDTYLLQLSPLLAALDDAKVKTWLLHPNNEVAFPLTLRDEPDFGAWLDEAKPGKLRIIQREDGLELSTAVGKLPGLDPAGPSVPVRSGQLDIATLRAGLARLKGRFTESHDLCVVPSFGTEVTKVATVLSGTYESQGKPFFEELCLVYPRPKTQGVPAVDAGRVPTK